MEATPPCPAPTKQKIQQSRWHTAVGASPPDDESAAAAFALDITEIRWDSHPFDPERFQWFMQNKRSVRPMRWSQIESRLHLSELRAEHRLEEGRPTLPLWQHYWQHHKKDNKLRSLEDNVITSQKPPDKPKKRPRAKEAAPEAPAAAPPAAIALPPAAPESEGHRDFLLSADPLSRTGSRPQILKAIACLVAKHTEASDQTRRFLSAKNLECLGCLYPTDTPSASGQPMDARTPESGALEMHRRAMRLERLASDLLQMLSGAGCEGLAADMAADAGCALAFWGGPGAEGDALWRDPGGKTGSALQPALAWMAANRGDALTRSYTVADELNWGLPLLATVWKCLQESKTPSRTLDRLAWEAGQCSRIRLAIYNRDKAPLISYGAHLTAVCQRLRSIGEALGAAPDPTPVLEFNTDNAWKCGQGRLELEPVRTACKQRLQAEERQIREMLRGVSLSHSPAVQAAAAIRRRQIEDMRTDTHTRGATRNLPATPSLPDAALDPRQYIPS